jgi:hypothetical protein
MRLGGGWAWAAQSSLEFQAAAMRLEHVLSLSRARRARSLFHIFPERSRHLATCLMIDGRFSPFGISSPLFPPSQRRLIRLPDLS